MARTRNSKNNGNGNRKKRQIRTRVRARGVTPNDVTLINHWKMLSDPCNAFLTESAYRGQAGMTARFARTFTLSGGSTTNYVYIANPQACATDSAGVLTPSTSYTPTYGGSFAGAAFLTANASAFRVIGFCLEIDYIGTELDRQGKVYTGVLPASQFIAGVPTTIDQMKLLLPNSTRTPDGSLESKWFPGVENEEFNAGNSGAGAFSNGRNGLVFIAENMPNGIQLVLTETVIYEWLPYSGTGFIMPSAVGGHNPAAAYERLHAAANADPSFAKSFSMGFGHSLKSAAHEAGQRMGAAAWSLGGRALGALASAGGAKLARAATPLLLTM
jgi:hypothetical protein